MLDAYAAAKKQQTLHYHQLEKPIALQTSLQANQARDPKRRKTPYGLDDFYMFQPADQSKSASARYGSAAMQLIKDGLYPGWALFCFTDLTAEADGHPPVLLAFLAEDAILLGPVEKPDGFVGLLIAEESASEQIREFKSPCGMSVRLKVPYVKTKTSQRRGSLWLAARPLSK